MSDARSKLSEALAKAENKRVAGAPAAKSASRPAPPTRSTSAPPRAPAPKQNTPKPKPKKAPKPKKTGPSAPNAMLKSLSKFANNMLDELKTATSEISPAALINTASDSLQSIKKAVGFDGTSSPTPEQTNTQSAPINTPSDTAQTSASNAPAIQHTTPDASEPTPSSGAPAQPMTSPAKVQRIASKKKTDATASPTQEAEPTQEDLLKQLTSDTPSDNTPSLAETTSPAKVQKAPSKKTESSANEPDLPEEDELTEQTPETDQNMSSTPEEISETSLPVENETSANAPEDKPAKKPAPKPQAAAISKTEHAIRGFQALHSLLTNPLWAPIITNLDTKPSSLYAPRENFDSNFSDPVFRAGLKSASRLASSYGFEPEKMRFNQKLIEQIKAIEIDPEGKIKAHTENISSVIGEEKVKEILGIYHNKNFKHLLFSVGTRMGSFVPTIESLARIYLSLRKKERLSSGERLQIQEEILMRYRKAPYTEDMGKKARNLALNYFTDYLSSYALKIYHDRFKDAPEGQDNIESSKRRHATIKAFCSNMIEEWAEKVALSSQAVMTMQAKFSDTADAHLEKLLNESNTP